MKKSILSLAMGAIVALTSCSQSDEMPGQPQEGEQLATFTIETPATTRAAVDGLTRYIVEAYEGATATGAPAIQVENSTGTLTLTLKKNTQYTFLFWADKGTAKTGSDGTSSGYWDTKDLKAVTVTDSEKSKKGEVAYCLTKTFNSDAFEANKAVELKNATAQVNFVEKTGVPASDHTLAVTYSAGATLNVSTGEVTEVTGEITHTFTGIAEVKKDETLAIDYILAPQGSQQVLDLTIQLDSEIAKSITNVPFQQCYKTNIKGDYGPAPKPESFTFTITANDAWNNSENEYSINWDGESPAANDAKTIMTDAQSTDGTGTAANYVFTITTAKQLAALAVLVNSSTDLGNDKYSAATYKLNTDIDLGNYKWTPIGGNNPFKGTFDGQGHTIRNMKVDENGSLIYAGLFGNMTTSGAIVKNLIVEGTVSASGTSSVYAGGICGMAMTGPKVEFCCFNGSVKSETTDSEKKNCTGGIVGFTSNNVSLIGCISNATVEKTGGAANNSGAGGLAGYASGGAFTYSAWKPSESFADAIGKRVSSPTENENKNFADITALNLLLSAINGGKTDSEYIWQAGASDKHPTLVIRNNN